MTKNAKKTGKNRLDKYYYLAKEQGFRARSAFKLVQLNKKFDFLSNAKVLIDLCAAPGGWLQVAQKTMPSGGLIIGVDLVPIKPIPGVITLAEDITTDKCRSGIRRYLKDWKADVVLHDGAPNVGTAWTQDAYGQNELVLHSLKLATEMLREGGTFVTKVFRSRDYTSLLWAFQQLFQKVEATKPASSRHESAEIFVICREFLAPDKIDPRLLDPRHVFAELEGTAKHDGEPISNNPRVNIFMPEKHQRHRAGYDDDTMIIFKRSDIVDFVCCKSPMDMLAVVNELSFTIVPMMDKMRYSAVVDYPMEKTTLLQKILKLATTEIQACCNDLKVLGKKEFRSLMKWRLVVRKKLGIEEAIDEQGDGKTKHREKGDNDEEIPSDTDEKISTAVSRMKQQEKKRKRVEVERKDRLRKRLSMMLDDHAQHQNDDENTLFSLNSVKKNAILLEKENELENILHGEDNNQIYDDMAQEIDDAIEKKKNKETNKDSDDDEEGGSKSHEVENLSKDDYDEEMSKIMDHLYDEFVERRGMRKRREKQRDDERKEKEARKLQRKGITVSNDGFSMEDASIYRDDEAEEQTSILEARKRRLGEDNLEDDEDLMDRSPIEKKGQKSKSQSKNDWTDINDNDEDEEEGTDESDESDDDDDDQLDSAPSRKKMTDSWFNHPVFQHAVDVKGISVDKKKKEEEESEEENAIASMKKKKNRGSKRQMDEEPSGDIEFVSSHPSNASNGSTMNDVEQSMMEMTDSDTSDEEDTKNMKEKKKKAATALTPSQIALASLMFVKKKEKSLMDAGYHRYNFNDSNSLPTWFLEDESRHRLSLKSTLMTANVVKEFADAKTATFGMEGHSKKRSTKKEMEAKQRQKKRSFKKLKRISAQANAVTENEDLTESQKMKQLGQLVAKKVRSTKEKRKKVSFIVAKGGNKGGAMRKPKGVKGKAKFVDGRLKKDMKAQKRTKKREKDRSHKGRKGR